MTSIISTKTLVDSQVLLLGAGGQLGQMLYKHWPIKGQLRAQSRQNIDGMLRFDPLDAPKDLRAAGLGVRAVICLSGVTPAHAAKSGDAMQLNTELALAAIEAAPIDARVFVISSAAVYGAADGPHSEGVQTCPVSDYGRAKREMEHAALALGDGRVCVLRIGNVAGADAILGGWREGMTLDTFADGRTPRRSYIGPKSLARVIHTLCMSEAVPDVINIAAPGVVSMGDLLNEAGCGWSGRAANSSAIEEVELDTARLEALYVFEPEECTARGIVAQLNDEDFTE